jgi:hypothetical protein
VIAILSRQYVVATRLIDAGAPLSTAVCSAAYFNDVAFLELVSTSHGFRSPYVSKTIAFTAAARGAVDVLRWLAAADMFPSLTDATLGPDCFNLVTVAARTGAATVTAVIDGLLAANPTWPLSHLVQAGGGDVTRAPAVAAALRGHVDVLELCRLRAPESVRHLLRPRTGVFETVLGQIGFHSTAVATDGVHAAGAGVLPAAAVALAAAASAVAAADAVAVARWMFLHMDQVPERSAAGTAGRNANGAGALSPADVVAQPFAEPSSSRADVPSALAGAARACCPALISFFLDEVLAVPPPMCALSPSQSTQPRHALEEARRHAKRRRADAAAFALTRAFLMHDGNGRAAAAAGSRDAYTVVDQLLSAAADGATLRALRTDAAARARVRAVLLGGSTAPSAGPSTGTSPAGFGAESDAKARQLLLDGQVSSLAMLDVLIEVLLPIHASEDEDTGADWWHPSKKGRTSRKQPSQFDGLTRPNWPALMKAALTLRSVVDYDFGNNHGDDQGGGHSSDAVVRFGATGREVTAAAADAAVCGSWEDCEPIESTPADPAPSAGVDTDVGAHGDSTEADASGAAAVWEQERMHALTHARSRPLWQSMLRGLVFESIRARWHSRTMPPPGLLLLRAGVTPPTSDITRFGVDESVLSAPLSELMLPPALQRLREAGVRSDETCALCCSLETPSAGADADAVARSPLLYSCSAAAGGCRGLRFRPDVYAAARLQRIIAGVTRAFSSPAAAHRVLFPTEYGLWPSSAADKLVQCAASLPTCWYLLLDALSSAPEWERLRPELLKLSQWVTAVDSSEACMKPLWQAVTHVGTFGARHAVRVRMALALGRLPLRGGAINVGDEASEQIYELVTALRGETHRLNSMSASLVLAQDEAEHEAERDAASAPAFALSEVKPVTHFRRLGAVLSAFVSSTLVSTACEQQIVARVIACLFVQALDACVCAGSNAAGTSDAVLARALNGQPADTYSPLEHLMSVWRSGELSRVTCAELLLRHGADYRIRINHAIKALHITDDAPSGTISVLHYMVLLASQAVDSSFPVADAFRRVIEAVRDGEAVRLRLRARENIDDSTMQ